MSRHLAYKTSDADAPQRHLTNFGSLLGRFLFLLVFFTGALNVDSDSGDPCRPATTRRELAQP